VSDGVRRTYEAIGVPSERLITVPNGVARCEAGAGRNAIRARLGLGIDQPVVITVGDPSALGPAVADLLTDEDRRKTYAAAGLRRYLESFTAQRMAARTHALYEHFLADACRVVDRPHIQP